MSWQHRIEKAGWIVSAILLSWFVYQSFVVAPVWQQFSWNTTSCVVLLVITFIYSLSLINSGLVSWWLLRSLGDQQATLTRVLAAGLLSQMAKYLPGNVAHHIGRVILSRQLQLSAPLVLYCMLIETLWVLGVTAALAVFYGFSQDEAIFAGLPVQLELPMIVAIIGLVIIGPYMFHGRFNHLYSWYLKKRGWHERGHIKLPSMFVTLFSVLAYLLNYVFLGLTIALLGGYLFNHWQFDILLLGSAFAVAWVAGFFTPGSPAGLGVREVILLGLLSPVYGAEISVGITTMLRLVTVAGDAMAWLFGGLMWHYALKGLPNG